MGQTLPTYIIVIILEEKGTDSVARSSAPKEPRGECDVSFFFDILSASLGS